MRISDWSSDVCSSDLLAGFGEDQGGLLARKHAPGVEALVGGEAVRRVAVVHEQHDVAGGDLQLGRREPSLVDRDRVVDRQVDLSQILCGRRARVCSRSEEHTSELQSLMRISYAVFCLKKKK